MKKNVLILMAIAMCAVVLSLSSCSSCSREMKTWQSDISGGLDRIVTVYSLDGKVLQTYEGKIDVQSSEGGKVLFDYNGKRIVWYNTPISVIEK